jgi:hypothetical protein
MGYDVTMLLQAPLFSLATLRLILAKLHPMGTGTKLYID